MADKLKPCPFCGGEAFVKDSGYRAGRNCIIGCDKCDIKPRAVFSSEHLNEAITAWNTRAQADRIEALEAALRFYRDAWEQDVDAELTAHGWEGSIGEIEPTLDLLNDRGERARKALGEQGND